jgi:hypothetical protein
MICKACLDANHSACDSNFCTCPECHDVAAGRTACSLCDGDGFSAQGGNCPRCQGSGRELADLAGVDRIGGGHGGK